MSEFKLDVLCVFGAVVGANVVVVPFLCIVALVNHLLIPKSTPGEFGYLPNAYETTSLLATVILLPIAFISGTLLGWAWIVKRIRSRYPKYEIL
jgi:uncharacterized RDD family membrane protein YckC